MPVQRTLFGRPIPRITPRRVAQLLASIAIFAVFTLLFTLPNSIPSGPSLTKFTDGHRLSIPKIPAKLPSASILNPFRPAAHAPPAQEDSTSGDSSWYSDWKWLSPFSSSVTLDETRSLLPPLAHRPPIYTYYDHTLRKEKDIKDAENDILLTWRRAWWAQGFKPIILGPAEAMKNPLYVEVQRIGLTGVRLAEITRWLAWESMGSGMLSDYKMFPMGPYDDPLLSSLRHGEYPAMRRYGKITTGLFSGPKADITAAVKAALASPELSSADDIVHGLPEEMDVVDEPKSIAFYDALVIASKYAKVHETAGAAGLKMLNQLINAHLHSTWQSTFTTGLAVLKPVQEHMTAIIEPALDLAYFLVSCPESPINESCPPNLPECVPCVSSTPMKISTLPFFRNTSTLYTIGVVPHPYTLTSINAWRDSIDVPYVRRETTRDLWLSTATKELLGTGVSSAPRVVKFKEAVASPQGASHSIWFTAESDFPTDLDWHFGFPIAKNLTDSRKLGALQVELSRFTIEPSPDDLLREHHLLSQAKLYGKSKELGPVRLRTAIEMWNLADVEAWRFARAYLARSGVERSKWQEEERKFAGGAGAERAGSQGWGRWWD